VCRKRNLYPQEKLLACGGQKIAMRTAENFYAHENKFLCAQKNIFMGIEIYLRAHENLTTLAEHNKPLFNSKLNYHDQDQSR